MVKDFFVFRKLLSPIFIQFLFWLGVFYSLFNGIDTMLYMSFFSGLWFLIIGIIFSRVFCELLLLLFRINDNLTEINAKTKK